MMRVHETVPIVLLLCYQAVNKDGEASCTPHDAKPISGEYLGELLTDLECEALALRRGLFLSARPDVFCLHKKLYRFIGEPLDSEKAKYTLHERVSCAHKQVCKEDELPSFSGIRRRWMRMKCVEELNFADSKPSNMPPPGRSPPNETAIDMKRSPCVVCKRKFPEDRLKTHEDICRSLKSKKRPVYNAAAHRLNGVATEQEIKKIIREKSKPTRLSQIPWRESHSAWSNTGDSRPKSGRKNQSQVSSDGRVQCSGCNRRFAPDVAEKHIPGCVERNKK